MTEQRKRYGAEFKFRVALEAAKGQKTLNELASEHGVHPNQISTGRSVSAGSVSYWDSTARRCTTRRGVRPSSIWT